MSMADALEMKRESPTTARIAIDPQAEYMLWDSVVRLAHGGLEKLTADELVDLALEIPPLLPTHLRRELVEYRRRAPHGDVLLVRGLIPDDVVLPPTVTSPSAPFSGSAHATALLLVGIMTLFGEPFNYKSLYGGRIVQNMVPVRAMEFTQTSQSSTGMLGWHVEDGYREDRCDYAGLICLRGDPSGASLYAQARDLALRPDLMTILRERRFQVRPDPAHVLPDDMPTRQLAVLTGPASRPEIVYDTHHIAPLDDDDDLAQAALRELHEYLDQSRVSHVMEMGDLLIFDNKRVVHARTPFPAKFDGTDRWLMRVMVCGSTQIFRRWGNRVPE
jgi:L-asparagine oxygenase